MSEVFEMGNQTQEEVIDTPVEPTETIAPESLEETPATTPDIPQAFKVKYNKEEVEVPYDQAPDYIQKGLNYEKVTQRAEEYQNHLNRVAQLTGYQSHEELLQALDEVEQAERVQREAQRMGVDEETYQKYFSPVNEELNQLKSQVEQFQTLEIQRQIDAELAELQQREDFSQHEQQMYEMATKYNMPLKEAFEYASLKALRDQLPNIQQQTEQKVIDQIKSRQGKHVETSDNNVAVELNLTPQEIEAAQKMGLTPEEYAKWK